MRVLLVDDDAELGAMLAEYLDREGMVTSLVHNGEDGVAAALGGEHDVVVLDVMLPGLNGVEALRRIRQTSAIPVIMLTAKGDHVDRVVGLEMGADDYMPKPCYPRELVARLRAVLRRSERGGPERDQARTVGGLTLRPDQRRVTWRDTPLDLTATEFNLLAALLEEPGRVLTKDELSLKALGRAREPYDRSVDVHVSNLRQKLAAAAGPAVEIATVRGVGYCLQEG
ncbi:MAG: response regulator transcription factor [Deltaproteobacteria bacterium]|nr:response regulator transcription factor [Deltaproteobacteria bacterium]